MLLNMMKSSRYNGSYPAQVLYWHYAAFGRLQNWPDLALMDALAKEGYVDLVDYPAPWGRRWTPSTLFGSAAMKSYIAGLPTSPNQPQPRKWLKRAKKWLNYVQNL